jgi:hypothetical protein
MNKCNCGNPEVGFDCVCDFVRKHPGENEFSCEHCGIYKAARPRCVMCENNQEAIDESISCIGCSYCYDGSICQHPDRQVTYIVSDCDIPDDCPLLERRSIEDDM